MLSVKKYRKLRFQELLQENRNTFQPRFKLDILLKYYTEKQHENQEKP